MPTRLIRAAFFIVLMHVGFSSGFAEAPAPQRTQQRGVLGTPPPRGIPRDLARDRAAQISDVRYRLAFGLVLKAATTLGEEELRFRLKAPQPVLLDFRDGRL